MKKIIRPVNTRLTPRQPEEQGDTPGQFEPGQADGHQIDQEGRLLRKNAVGMDFLEKVERVEDFGKGVGDHDPAEGETRDQLRPAGLIPTLYPSRALVHGWAPWVTDCCRLIQSAIPPS